MLSPAGTATTGSVQHEGVRYDSNSLTPDRMREVLEIPAADAPAEPAEPAPAADPDPTPTPAPAETPAAPAATETPEQLAAKGKKKPQERIDKLVYEREEAKREAARVREESQRQIQALREEMRRELETVRRPAEPPRADAKPADPDPEPTLDQFADQQDPYASWMRATAKWDARREFREQAKLHAEAAQVQRRQYEQHQKQTQERQRIGSWAQRMETAFTANPEMRSQIEDMPVLPRPMMDVIIDSEIPSQILQHLINHPEEQAQIMNLPPLHQYRAVSRIEYQLEQAAQLTGSAAALKPKTTAHPPVSPVSGSHAAPVSSGEPGPNASYEEHRAYWNTREAEERKRRR